MMIYKQQAKKNWMNVFMALFYIFMTLFILFCLDQITYPAETETSPRNGLNLMHFNEGQPHLIFNDLVYFIDALTFPILSDYPADTTPPEEPDEGDLYIIPSGSTGEWYGHDGDLAIFVNGSWKFMEPKIGWTVNLPEFSTLRFNGEDWTQTQGSVDTNQLIVKQSTGIPGINLQTDYVTAMLGITTGIANAEIIKVSEESIGTSMLTINKYKVGGAFILLGNYSESIYEGMETLLLHPRDPSYFYGNLYVGGGSTGYAETPLVIAGATTLSATTTPADPEIGKAVLWLDNDGNLKIKSNVNGTIHSGTLFEY